MMREPIYRVQTPWKKIAGWGVTWGIVISFIEWLSFSTIEEWDTLELLRWWLLTWMAPGWCLIGCVFVWMTERTERNGGVRGMILGWLGVAAAAPLIHPPLALASQVYFRTDTYAWGFATNSMSKWAWLGLYDLWMGLFYGGLLVAAYALNTRAERTRKMLHIAAMARSNTEILLDGARLEALQAQIDPGLLLDSMRELELRYRSRPDRAERLLEVLVEFLRFAIPSLRERESTVEAELRLANAYARLQQERGIQSAWRIEGSAPLAAHMRFPSLFMLPLLVLADDGRPSLKVACENGDVTLSFIGLNRPLSAMFARRLRTQLGLYYGQHFEVRIIAEPEVQVIIRLGSSNNSRNDMGVSYDVRTIFVSG